MRRRLIMLVGLLAVAFSVGAGAVGAASATAAERRCGDMGSRAPDYYDVRARKASCRAARRTVRRWVKSLSSGSVFDAVDVGAYSCDGRRSKRRIAGVRTFYIRCVDGSRRVRWWIRPSH